MKTIFYYFSLIMFLFMQDAMAQTKIIAHRGFWDTSGSAQNSIAALLKADSIGCYGSEFDVWMAGDGELVVNHDASYKGVKMDKATVADINKLKLANGEPMPTLTQYFEAAKKTNIKLILELKKLSSVKLETEAVEKIVALAKSYGLDHRIEYISFSKHATEEFIRLAPKGTAIFYLNGNLNPQQLKEMGCAGPDYNLSVFKKHPNWIEECHQLGMKVNVWTVNKESDMEWCINHKIDFITTDKPVLLQHLIASQQ